MMKRSWSSTLVGAALTVACCVSSPTLATAAGVAAPTRAVATTADTYVNTIRNYYFCATKACKKSRPAQKIAAGSAMVGLLNEAESVVKGPVPAAQRATAGKFVGDVRALASAIEAYQRESSVSSVARNIGMIYYQSANVGSDVYLLASAVHGTKVVFGPWSVGAVAVLYAMQVDTSALNAKSATVADDVAASKDLESEANSLLGDANGPSAQFNSLISTFASTQQRVSVAAILLLEKKSSAISAAQVSALSKQLVGEYKAIVTLQAKLAK